MWATQTILESQENNLLKWYGHVVRMDYKLCHKRIMTWSPEGRGRRGRPDVKWEKEVESVMMQRSLRSDDAVNRLLRRMETVNPRTLANDREMDGWMDGWMGGWMDGWVGGWMDGWMDGRTDGWMDGWMDDRMIIM